MFTELKEIVDSELYRISNFEVRHRPPQLSVWEWDTITFYCNPAGYCTFGLKTKSYKPNYSSFRRI